jgi:hypothetical protein
MRPTLRLSNPHPRRAPHRRGAVLQVGLGLIAAGAVGLVAATSLPTRRLPDPPPPMRSIELEVALRVVDLTPESLASAGLSGPDVTGLVGRARSDLSPVIEDYREAHTDFGSARAEVDRLERLVRSGLASQEQVTALTTARSAFTAANTAHDNHQGAAFTAATEESLTGPQVAALVQIRANTAWDLPSEYKVRSATEPEWVALRDALAAERIAQREGSEVPAGAQSVLTAWRADPAVSAARASLASNLAAVSAAYSAAVAGGG